MYKLVVALHCLWCKSALNVPIYHSFKTVYILHVHAKARPKFYLAAARILFGDRLFTWHQRASEENFLIPVVTNFLHIHYSSSFLWLNSNLIKYSELKWGTMRKFTSVIKLELLLSNALEQTLHWDGGGGPPSYT